MSLPELAHLEKDQRRKLINDCAGSFPEGKIIVKCGFFGLICGFIIASIVHGMIGNREWGVFGMILAPSCMVIVFVLTYQFYLQAVRASLRNYVKQAMRGEKMPMCLECGYNLSACTTERCPECGAPVRVPEK